jgi:gluconokinase
VVAAVLARAPVVVACSALKRSYRDRLRAGAPGSRFIYLSGSRTLLRQRISGRVHEFMPPELLESQLAILEPPAADERALTIDIRSSPEAMADNAFRWLTQK